MDFPSPDDPALAPVWENYVTAQGAQAALRKIPDYVYALGVQVDGNDVRLVVQQGPDAPSADERIDDTLDTLSDLLGPRVTVALRVDVRPRVALSPFDGVRWFFAAP